METEESEKWGAETEKGYMKQKKGQAFAQAARVAGAGSYTLTTEEFLDFLSSATNPHQVEYAIRSLEKYPPIYAWGFFWDIAEAWFNTVIPHALSREGREMLGPVLLDVFFKKFPSPTSEVSLIPLDGVFGSQLLFEFFSCISDKIKRGYEQKIRKWLSDLCQSARLTDLDNSQRAKFAHALVVNGCFEECVAYDIFEAIFHLKKLALGEFSDMDNGLKSLNGLATKNPLDALKEHHNAHAWSAMLTLMARRGDLTVARIIDPTGTSLFDPNEVQVLLRQAIIFQPHPRDAVWGL